MQTRISILAMLTQNRLKTSTYFKFDCEYASTSGELGRCFVQCDVVGGLKLRT